MKYQPQVFYMCCKCVFLELASEISAFSRHRGVTDPQGDDPWVTHLPQGLQGPHSSTVEMMLLMLTSTQCVPEVTSQSDPETRNIHSCFLTTRHCCYLPGTISKKQSRHSKSLTSCEMVLCLRFIPRKEPKRGGTIQQVRYHIKQSWIKYLCCHYVNNCPNLVGTGDTSL